MQMTQYIQKMCVIVLALSLSLLFLLIFSFVVRQCVKSLAMSWHIYYISHTLYNTIEYVAVITCLAFVQSIYFLELLQDFSCGSETVKANVYFITHLTSFIFIEKLFKMLRCR